MRLYLLHNNLTTNLMEKIKYSGKYGIHIVEYMNNNLFGISL